jgi:hypothetical protein
MMIWTDRRQKNGNGNGNGTRQRTMMISCACSVNPSKSPNASCKGCVYCISFRICFSGWVADIATLPPQTPPPALSSQPHANMNATAQRRLPSFPTSSVKSSKEDFQSQKLGNLHRLPTMKDEMHVQAALDSLLHSSAAGGNEERKRAPASTRTETRPLSYTRRTTFHKHNASLCYAERPQRMRPREEVPSSSFRRRLWSVVVSSTAISSSIPAARL